MLQYKDLAQDVRQAFKDLLYLNAKAKDREVKATVIEPFAAWRIPDALLNL